ncbi:MAG: glycine cleavage system protein GcvH [Isosphaeraceae bacterium]
MDPKTLRYTESHEWIAIADGVATVGISRFAVDQLSDLITIELPKVGAKVTAGKSFGEVESVKNVSDLYAPVSGEVVAINTDVAQNVGLLTEDPFEKGWLVKIKLDPAGPTTPTLDFAAYEKHIADNAH